ncbi:predicted protein [Nematostella vectensis]|uniref:C-type lectin domain-containing protein n=1 Tax=Nematostella vectensis TaxID=45351 RepID=A7RVX6_NEMVE|nr:predicted protein [Nematostella vectensis]|eukprot:XP_001636377.1 predicted protein [Nematostella vectensis]
MNFDEAKLRCFGGGAQLFVKPPGYGFTQVFSDINGIIYGSFSASRYHVGLVRNSSSVYWLDGTYLPLSSLGSCGYLYFMSASNILLGCDICKASRYICQKPSNGIPAIRNTYSVRAIDCSANQQNEEPFINKETIVRKNPHLFNGLGKLSGEYTIRLKEGAKTNNSIDQVKTQNLYKAQWSSGMILALVSIKPTNLRRNQKFEDDLSDSDIQALTAQMQSYNPSNGSQPEGNHDDKDLYCKGQNCYRCGTFIDECEGIDIEGADDEMESNGDEEQQSDEEGHKNHNPQTVRCYIILHFFNDTCDVSLKASKTLAKKPKTKRLSCDAFEETDKIKKLLVDLIVYLKLLATEGKWAIRRIRIDVLFLYCHIYRKPVVKKKRNTDGVKIPLRTRASTLDSVGTGMEQEDFEELSDQEKLKEEANGNEESEEVTGEKTAEDAEETRPKQSQYNKVKKRAKASKQVVSQTVIVKGGPNKKALKEKEKSTEEKEDGEKDPAVKEPGDYKEDAGKEDDVIEKKTQEDHHEGKKLEEKDGETKKEIERTENAEEKQKVEEKPKLEEPPAKPATPKLKGIQRVNAAFKNRTDLNRRLQSVLKVALNNEIADADMKVRRDSTIDYLAQYRLVDRSKIEVYGRAFTVEDEDEEGILTYEQMLMALEGVPTITGMSRQQLNYVLQVITEFTACEVHTNVVEASLQHLLISWKENIDKLRNYSCGTGVGDKLRFTYQLQDVRSHYRTVRASNHIRPNGERPGGRAGPLSDGMETRPLQGTKQVLKRFTHNNMFYVTGDRSATFISSENLRIELKAGGLSQIQEDHVIRHIMQTSDDDKKISFLDYMAYLPLFLSIHENICANALDMSRDKYTKKKR